MKNSTITQLYQINDKFYQDAAAEFSDTRNYFWPGWEQLSSLITQNFTRFHTSSDHPANSSYRILDVGCGNARLAEFLVQTLPDTPPWHYYGIDSSNLLLQIAQEKIEQKILTKQDISLHVETKFILEKITLHQQDFDQFLKKNGNFNLITMFGVLHHLPEFNFRLKLITQLIRNLSPSGLLIISLWQFFKDERLRRKICTPNSLDIDDTDLEENDFILDWQNSHWRYCHHFSDQEIDLLIQKILVSFPQKITLIDRFQSDGPPQNPLNTYLVFQKN